MSAPAYRAYTITKREPLPDGKPNDFWLNIGVAFSHEDGQGYNILLQAMPTDGKIVLRRYKEKPDEQEADVSKAKEKGYVKKK